MIEHAEIDASTHRSRTRWSMLASVILHAVVLVFLVMLPRDTRAVAAVTEISLMDPGDVAKPAAPAAAGSAAVVTSGASASADRDERFRRALDRAAVTPEPQSDAAFDDRLNARLAAIQGEASHPSPGVIAAAPTPWPSAPAMIGGAGGGGAPRPLVRGGGEGGSPLPLARGADRGAPPTLASAPSVPVERHAASAGGDASARRTLAGATLMGPIADRAVLAHATPIYPEWAKRDAVEGSVTLYFIVEPGGTVRENVLVQRTAGFTDFDENARAALKAWRFAPLSEGRVGDQWGTITFNFRLRD